MDNVKTTISVAVWTLSTVIVAKGLYKLGRKVQTAVKEELAKN